MSSRTAATRALLELLDLQSMIKDFHSTFKTYSKMRSLNMSRMSYYRKLKKFQKFGLIKEIKTAIGPAFVITPKAKWLRAKAVTKKHRTDGMATLIIFDIPEEKRKARDTLRRYLIRIGYTQIKESCFLSPFEITSDLKQLIEELKIKSNVSVFSAKMNLL